MFRRILVHFAADYQQNYLERKYLIIKKKKLEDMDETEIRQMKTWVYMSSAIASDRWDWESKRPDWINRLHPNMGV